MRVASMFGWSRKPKKTDPGLGGREPLPETEHPALSLQKDYWKCNPVAKARLLGRDPASLSWSETFRLHHLLCLEMLETGGGQAALNDEIGGDEEDMPSPAIDRCRETAGRLLSAESPYRARQCSIWQGNPGESGDPEPDLQGWLMNASLTHLGSLEVIRLNEQGLPRELDFIPLDDIRGMVFAPPALFRAAKIFYDDGRGDEIILVPLIYGVSWATDNEYYHGGRMTRFVSFVDLDGRSIGIGYGQQDWKLATEGGETLFGLGSVGEVMVALELGDPRFEQKCRARGLDPVEVKNWGREGG